jgi:hypothetical protein
MSKWNVGNWRRIHPASSCSFPPHPHIFTMTNFPRIGLHRFHPHSFSHNLPSPLIPRHIIIIPFIKHPWPMAIYSSTSSSSSSSGADEYVMEYAFC